LSRKRQDAFEHGDADREIIVEVKERGEKVRRLHRNQLGDGQCGRGLKAIESPRNAI
jgi:hypothetical protein